MSHEFAVVWAHKDRLLEGLANTIWLSLLATAIALVVVALIAAVPIIGNQVIQIIKDSAFLTILAVPELTQAASAIQSTYFVPFAAFVAAVALYWVLCRAVELTVAWTERRAEERR